MAVRFLDDGSYVFLDPVGVGSTAGNAGEFVDDGSRPLPWEDRPFQSRQDYLANEAMFWATVPRAQIAQIRPPVPQQLFPPAIGYPGEALTIEDVLLDGDNWVPTMRSWISGRPRVVRMYDLQDEGRGTIRPAMGTVNPMV